MTISAAEKLAERVVDKKDEKPEKRRALGRGLESLLPGPRVGVSSIVAPGVGPNGEARVASPAFTAATGQAAATASLPTSAAHAGDLAVPAVISIQARGDEIGGGVVTNLPLDVIDRTPYQPRKVFHPEGLDELRDSIKEHGVVQPIV